MKTLSYMLFTTLILFTSSTAQVWTNMFGLKTSGNRISSVKCDDAGGVWLGGFWVGSLTLFDTMILSTDYADCYVAKTDTGGHISRLITFGGPGYDYLYDVGIRKNGSVVVTGTFQQSMLMGDKAVAGPAYESLFLAEFGDEATPRWVTTATALAGKSLALLDNGNIAVAGNMTDTAVFGNADTLFGHGSQDFFVALYGPAGEIRWARGGGGNQEDFVKNITVGNGNALYVVGCFSETMIFNSDTVRSSSNSVQSFVARLDSAGNTTWLLPLSSDGAVNAEKVVIDDAENIYVTGSFTGTLVIDTVTISPNDEYDFFLAALTADGRVRWVRHAQLATGNDIAFGRNNELFVAGNFKWWTSFGSHEVKSVDIEDVFIGNYSSDGTCNWVMTAGGCRSAIGWKVAANQRNVFIAGEVDANRTCASCPMRFGALETPYTSDDYGRSFLAIADYTIENSVRPQQARFAQKMLNSRFKARQFDLSGREIRIRQYDRTGSTGRGARQAAIVVDVDGKGTLSLEVR